MTWDLDLSYWVREITGAEEGRRGGGKGKITKLEDACFVLNVEALASNQLGAPIFWMRI